jgi:DNA-binding winged helix-turn-helix (wHTH) protein
MIVFRAQDIRFCLDRHAGLLWRGRERVHLPRKEWELLCYLAENPGKLISKEELLQQIWKDTSVSDASLDQAVSKVRRALGDRADDPLFIETVKGRGYRFVAEIESTVSIDGSTSPEARPQSASLDESPVIRRHWLRVSQQQLADSLAAHLGLPSPRAFRFVEETGDIVPQGSYLELEGGARISFSWEDVPAAVTRLCRTLVPKLMDDGFAISAFVARPLAGRYGEDLALPLNEPIHVLLEKGEPNLAVASTEDLTHALESYAFELPDEFDRSHLNALPRPSPAWDVLAELIQREAWGSLKRTIVDVGSMRLGIATQWAAEIVRRHQRILDKSVLDDLRLSRPKDPSAIRLWAEGLLDRWAEIAAD